MKIKYFPVIFLIFINFFLLTAKADELIPDLKYIKQPGLAHASSKIYSADQDFALSGFGEINFVQYTNEKDRSGELENYYSNLYRSGTYIGYKFSDRVIFNSEIQMEYLHDGSRENDFEINVEAIVDVLFNQFFNIRVGNYPIPLGYVNINEDPLEFYTVNRPDVERIIIPTQWLDVGLMFYGNITSRLEYNFGITKGLDATRFSSSTWIRDGRFIDYSRPNDVAFNAKLQYELNDWLLLGVSGYTGRAGNGNMLSTGQELTPRVSIFTSFAELKLSDDFSFFGLMARGKISNTQQIYQFSNQVMGEDAFGHYIEARWDILPLFSKSLKYKTPLFLRYERLNTHDRVDDALASFNRDQNDLSIVSVGFNIRQGKNIVYKGSYQFRKNDYELAEHKNLDRVEFGFGFIY